jgi:hypothetical protein
MTNTDSIAIQNTSATHTMPLLPAELWAAIFAYTSEQVHTWCNYRSTSSEMQADVDVYFTTDVLPFYVRVRVAYYSHTSSGSELRWCDRAKFLHYRYSPDPDRRLAYFDVSTTEQTTQIWDDDTIFVMVVVRDADEMEGEVDVLAWQKGENHSVLCSPRFPIKAVRGSNADITGNEGEQVLIEIDV